MEGDILTLGICAAACDFNPLPPHGGRQYTRATVNGNMNFNPLPPHGGRHSVMAECFECLYISIHSLRMEGDLVKLIKFWAENISIHSLRMEGDRWK